MRCYDNIVLCRQSAYFISGTIQGLFHKVGTPIFGVDIKSYGANLIRLVRNASKYNSFIRTFFLKNILPLRPINDFKQQILRVVKTYSIDNAVFPLMLLKTATLLRQVLVLCNIDMGHIILKKMIKFIFFGVIVREFFSGESVNV